MNALTSLESRSIYIIREAFAKFDNPAVLWSMGKDSTVLLYLIRKAFFGRVPFPVVHIDTGYKFKEIYDFRDKWAKEWGLNLVVARNDAALTAGMGPERGRLVCCRTLKTDTLKTLIGERGYDAVLLGIRRDEHGIRAKERVFSPRSSDFTWNFRDQPPEMWEHFKYGAEEGGHIRVHPMLQWTELDVWEYIKRKGIPVNKLYFAINGRRYRSIGCEPCCQAVPSNATDIDDIIEELKSSRTAERAGRAQDKESAYMMQKLRSMGYM